MDFTASTVKESHGSRKTKSAIVDQIEIDTNDNSLGGMLSPEYLDETVTAWTSPFIPFASKEPSSRP